MSPAIIDSTDIPSNGVQNGDLSSLNATSAETAISNDHDNGAASLNPPNGTEPKEVPTPVVASNLHTLSLFNLSGKTALVTGGNGGIGSGMARGLAEAGADIIIFRIPGDKSKFPVQLASEIGRKVSVYDCDMSDTMAIRCTVQKVLDDGHVVDILCNVAGISSGSIPILEETDEHKDKIIQINFNAVWVMSQVICRHMVDRGSGGKIINICSLAAHKAMTKFSVYGPMKAAVGQLTNSFANEFGPYNIQVNALYPGWIKTSLAERFFNNPETNEKIIKGIPAGRWGEPADFKGVTVFLASSASDYISGARIFIDGGTHSM